MRKLGCIFLCDRNLFLGPQKPFLPGFLRIPEDFFFFRRNFSQEPPFGGGRRNSCFLPISQEFFAGIPVGQEFLYLVRIPPEISGILRIPVPAKSYAGKFSTNWLSHQQAHLLPSAWKPYLQSCPSTPKCYHSTKHVLFSAIMYYS
jgi:hypothetical protein